MCTGVFCLYSFAGIGVPLEHAAGYVFFSFMNFNAVLFAENESPVLKFYFLLQELELLR